MHQLMYVSAAAGAPGSPELGQILAVSRRNNLRDDVTGMLLHIDGGFLQILEGPHEAVRRAYHRIAQDPRHDTPTLLLDRPVEERLFPDWSMGFDRLAPDQTETAGVFAITRRTIDDVVNENHAAEVAIFLRTFYRVNAHRHST